MANVRRRTKFRADRSNRCRDTADFQFFKITIVRHLGLLKVPVRFEG